MNSINTTTEKQMNLEIRKVSNHRALLIAKQLCNLLLILYFVPAAMMGMEESPALYILLLHNLLPGIFYFIFSDQTKQNAKKQRILKPSAYDTLDSESEHKKQKKANTSLSIFAKEVETDTPLLPQLRKKYQYSRIKFQSNSISFLLTCFFLFLWQQQNNVTGNFTFYRFLPLCILTIIVVTRLGFIMIYHYVIHHDLLYGRL